MIRRRRRMPTPNTRALPLPPDENSQLSDGERRRIDLTVSCRDTDLIPKVPDAGHVKLENGIMVQVMHDGTRIVAGCYQGAWMTEVIRRLRGHHEPQEEIVVHHIIERLRAIPTPRPSAIVEVGAFWSYYSIWAMRTLRTPAVLIEPDPHNLEVGRANVALNGLDAKFINAAVGGPHGGRLRLACESDGVTRRLPIVTLDGVLAETGFDTIDLLLVDAQGPEFDVLERAQRLLRAGRIRFAVISTHHHSISGDPMTHQRCLHALQLAGAHIIAEHSVGESFSGDGLIAASMLRDDDDLDVPISFARYRDSLFGELEPELAAARDEIARMSATAH